MYRNLNTEKVNTTLKTLQSRIDERFPQSGISCVCAELNQIANESTLKVKTIIAPNIYIRLSVSAIILLASTIIFYGLRNLSISFQVSSIGELVQISESATNELVLLGAALFFLVTIESRIKRNQTLTILHELRSIAHVIDMHQLTKDPSIVAGGKRTSSSPTRSMSSFELTRYLDYCSEMLSLTAKVSALYAQHLKDEVVLNTVNEIEMLTSGMSNKIWQKIIILNRLT